MSNNKESSVEWYDNEIEKLFNQFIVDKITIYKFRTEQLKLKQQAKAKHEQEITDAHTTGYVIGGGNGDIYEPKQYYNETFGGNNEQQ